MDSVRHTSVMLAATWLALTSQSIPALSQGGAPPTPGSQASSAALLSPADLDSLVGPVALYPDPLLSLVMQASTQPLQIVQADRFLEKRKSDPSAQPPSDWDTSVLGLLNYAPVVHGMSEQLDWTQKLGHAVLDQLSDVQASIQQVRAEVRARGGLKSDDKNTVIVQNGLIEIQPADPDKVYIPQYDAASLVAPNPAPQPDAKTSTTTTEARPASTTAQTVPSTTTVVVEQPSYVYAYPPPPVAYSEPYPSYASSAATFLGGAVVGGLLGYAIGDDDRDVDVNVNRSWNRYDPGPARFSNSGNRTNVSGNTVNVINSGDRISATTVQSELQQRAGSTDIRGTQVVGPSTQPGPARPPISAIAGGPAVAPVLASTTPRSVDEGRLGNGGFGQVSSAREASATRSRTEATRATWRSTRSTDGRQVTTDKVQTTDVTRTSGSVLSGANLGAREGSAGERGAASRLGNRSGGRIRG